MSFRTRLKELRLEKELTQEDLAKVLKFTRAAISGYELGRNEPSYEVLQKLSDFFDVSIDYLLGRTDERNSKKLNIINNIELIMGKLTTNEFAEQIKQKTGIDVITSDSINKYLRGEVIPQAGTLKVLSMYANVDISFFEKSNSPESFKREQEKFIQKNEHQLELQKALQGFDISYDNLPYLKIAKMIKDRNLNPLAVEKLIDSLTDLKK